MGLTILINAVFRKNSNFSLEAKEMAGNWKTRKINWETRNNIKISIPHIACNFSCKKETNGGKIYTNSYFHKWENVQNFQGDLHHYSTWYSIIALVTPRLIRFLKWFWNSKEAVKADWKSHTETGLHDCGKACPSNLQKDQKQRLTFSFLFTPPSRVIYWGFVHIDSFRRGIYMSSPCSRTDEKSLSHLLVTESIRNYCRRGNSICGLEDNLSTLREWLCSLVVD